MVSRGTLAIFSLWMAHSNSLTIELRALSKSKRVPALIHHPNRSAIMLPLLQYETIKKTACLMEITKRESYTYRYVQKMHNGEL